MTNDPAGNQRLFMLSCLDPLHPSLPPTPHILTDPPSPPSLSLGEITHGHSSDSVMHTYIIHSAPVSANQPARTPQRLLLSHGGKYLPI